MTETTPKGPAPSAEKTHVVVTRAAPVREGGRVITHVYGPYTKNQVIDIRRKMLKNAEELGYRNRIEVTACRMLDPEMANG